MPSFVMMAEVSGGTRNCAQEKQRHSSKTTACVCVRLCVCLCLWTCVCVCMCGMERFWIKDLPLTSSATYFSTWVNAVSSGTLSLCHSNTL